MRLDHIAYRVSDRNATAQFFCDALGYKHQAEFNIDFDDGTVARCLALEPPEKMHVGPGAGMYSAWNSMGSEMHLPPEIFVSDGDPGSIVGRWVAERAGVGGIHHVAYQVDDINATMHAWMSAGLATFTSNAPMSCPGLLQAFTDPHPLTGIVYELIERSGQYGFCRDNVRRLMVASDGRR